MRKPEIWISASLAVICAALCVTVSHAGANVPHVKAERQIRAEAGTQAQQTERREWLYKVMMDCASIKPGMKRSDLAKNFTRQGGLVIVSSKYPWTYIYNGCDYVKTDIVFQLKTDGHESPDDTIKTVSKPYLEYFRIDN